MKIKRFKEWYLNEVGTSTACVANFMQPISGVVRRVFPDTTDEFFKKKKKDK